MATKVINSLAFGDTYVLTTPYATCATAASTAAKVATITPGSAFSLETGVRVSVKFTNALSVAAPTLNVNSSGAKAIYFRGSTLTSAQYWAAGSTVDFVYDGTYWQMLGSQHNSTYSLSSFGITASAAELNYTDGVTSNIQTQLNNKLNLSGGTVTGQLDVDTVLRNGNTFYNVLEFARTNTPVEIVVKTKIPYASSNGMPLIHLKGYAYGESAVIEMTVAFYIHSGNYTNHSVVSTCPWKPTVYLSSYTEGDVKYVALSFAGSIYYPRFVIDYTDIWSGSSNRDYSSGWTVACRTDASADSIIPSTNKVTVPYKPIANDILGNASTATNVAWSGITSKPSYYDAKAIKGITRSGTTFTYTCMDGTTGTFSQQDNNTNTAHSHTAGTGLTISGSGGTSGTTTYSANLNSTTSLGTIGTTSKLYAVGVDSAGKLCVNVPWTDTDTNTHYTTKLFATSSTGTAHATTTNGNTYLRLFDDSTARQSIKIIGSGATSVTSDANGVITISSTDTNTHPSVVNNGPTLSWGSTATIGTVGGTALTVKMPTNPNTNTAHAHTAGTGLTVTGSGGTTGTTTYSANLNSTTSLGTIGTTSQLYAVGVDDNGKLCANVPWTDNKVAQIHASTTGTAAYPVLFSSKTVTSGTGNVTSSVGKNELLYYYPSGGRLVVGTDELLSELHPDDSDDFVEAFPDGYGSLYVGGNLYVGAGHDAYGILPYQNNYSTIGSQDRKWWYVYATNVSCSTLHLGGVAVSASYPYFLGTRCTSSATTVAKTANAVGFSSTYFKTGATITVNFVNAHSSATAATFNLSGTGAKTIMRYGKTITSANGNSWADNGLVKLQYDGTYWQWIDETPQWNQYST